VVNDVKKRLGYQDNSDVKEEILEYELSKTHEKNMSYLKEIPREQANQAIRMANELIKDGLDKKKAVNRALEFYKPQFQKELETRKERVENGQLPAGKNAAGMPQYTEKYMSQLSQSEFNKVMDDVESGKAEIIR
jgi:uncharacterized protein YdaT